MNNITVLPQKEWAADNNETTPIVNSDWSTLFCYPSAAKLKFYTPFEIFFYGYAMPVLCFFGACANIINVIVLTDKRLAARTYIYLAFLSFADLCTLLLYLIDLLAKIHFAGQLWHELYGAYVYLPIGSVTTSSSLMLKVAFTVDRFIYIRNPAVQTGKLNDREQLRVRLFSGGLILVSALINIPRMFALQVDMTRGCRKFRAYAGRSRGWFGIYSYIRLATLNVGSIVLLAVFNFLLILIVHRSSTRSHRDSVASLGRSNQSAQQRSLTLTLIAATFLALSGEIPSTLFNRTSAGVLWGSSTVLDKQPFRSLVIMAYTLLLLEYSGNFITYFLLNKKFRAILLAKVCRSGERRGTIGMSRVVTEHDPNKLRRQSANPTASSAPLIVSSGFYPYQSPNSPAKSTEETNDNIASKTAPGLLKSRTQSFSCMATIDEHEEVSSHQRSSQTQADIGGITFSADDKSDVV